MDLRERVNSARAAGSADTEARAAAAQVPRRGQLARHQGELLSSGERSGASLALHPPTGRMGRRKAKAAGRGALQPRHRDDPSVSNAALLAVQLAQSPQVSCGNTIPPPLEETVNRRSLHDNKPSCSGDQSDAEPQTCRHPHPIHRSLLKIYSHSPQGRKLVSGCGTVQKLAVDTTNSSAICLAIRLTPTCWFSAWFKVGLQAKAD
jgi:hypothetical protein